MLLFALTIFSSALLLFQVQPLIARFILPWFGGAPAVWTSCMLFFQVVLLLGYLYADLLTRFLRPKAQVIVHAVLAGGAIFMLPIVPDESWKPVGDESPTLRIMLLLAATIGLPYFLLSTTGPLVQAWFARRYPGRSPYRLFALSNFGSLLALVSYPLFLESLFATRYQAYLWGSGFLVFALLVVATGWYSLKGSALVGLKEGLNDPSKTAEATGRVNAIKLMGWVGLAMIPSVLLLATTNQICQEVAVVPFLWVLPLSIYLISFIICFDKPHWYSREFFAILLLASMGCVIYSLIKFGGGELFFTLASFLLMLFAACMTCHGELAQMRPANRHLTLYYLMISVGGALGGLFVALAAPLLFKGFFELHWAIFAAVFGTFLTMLWVGSWHSLARICFLVACGILAISFVAFFDNRFTDMFVESWGARWAFILAYGLVTFVLLGWNDDWRRYKERFLGTSENTAGRTNALNWPWFIALGIIFLAMAYGMLEYPEATIKYWKAALLVYFLLLIIFAMIFQVRFGLPENWRGVCGAIFTLGTGLIVGLYLSQHANKPDKTVVEIRRDFYGLLKIKELDAFYYFNGESHAEGQIRELVNGRILHGTQYTRPDLRMRITSYYGEGSGVGLAVARHPKRIQFDRLSIGVVGLGAGTMAGWTMPQDKITFYEINPEVVEIAKSRFYYLSESAGENEVILGDARIQMERQTRELSRVAEANGTELQGIYDVLVIDAFSSDAIPRHLLTEESFRLYRQLVRPDGILAVHVSNHYLDLRPITYSLAEQAQWTAKIVNHDPDETSEPDRYLSASTWILVSNNEAFWNDSEVEQSAYTWNNPWRIHWTDDFGSLVQVLRAPKWLKQPDWWPWKEFWLRREK